MPAPVVQQVHHGVQVVGRTRQRHSRKRPVTVTTIQHIQSTSGEERAGRPGLRQPQSCPGPGCRTAAARRFARLICAWRRFMRPSIRAYRRKQAGRLQRAVSGSRRNARTGDGRVSWAMPPARRRNVHQVLGGVLELPAADAGGQPGVDRPAVRVSAERRPRVVDLLLTGRVDAGPSAGRCRPGRGCGQGASSRAGASVRAASDGGHAGRARRTRRRMANRVTMTAGIPTRTRRRSTSQAVVNSAAIIGMMGVPSQEGEGPGARAMLMAMARVLVRARGERVLRRRPRTCRGFRSSGKDEGRSPGTRACRRGCL